MLAGIGAILTLGIDQMANYAMVQYNGSPETAEKHIESGEVSPDAQVHPHENDKYIAGKCEHKCDHQHQHGFTSGGELFQSSHEVIKAWILEGAVATHSVIIGFGFGCLTRADVGAVRILTVAFSIHQFFEGIMLGSAAVNSSFSTWEALKFGVTFAITLPLGAVLGLIIRSYESNTETNSAILTQGITNALAAGILLHTALTEMIPEDFSHSHDPQATNQSSYQKMGSNTSNKGSLKFGMYLSLSFGFAVMAILALWA